LAALRKLPAACQADEELAPDGSCAPLFSPLVCAEEGQSVDAAGERCAAAPGSAMSVRALGVHAGAIASAALVLCVAAVLLVAVRRRLRARVGAEAAGASAPVQAGVAAFTSHTPRPPSPVHQQLGQVSVQSSPTMAGSAGVGNDVSPWRGEGAAFR
jgi:hypothetical protein